MLCYWLILTPIVYKFRNKYLVTCILKFGTIWNWAISVTLRSSYLSWKFRRCLLDRRLCRTRSRSKYCAGEKNHFIWRESKPSTPANHPEHSHYTNWAVQAVITNYCPNGETVYYFRILTHMKERINSNEITAGKTQGRNLAEVKYKNRLIVEFWFSWVCFRLLSTRWGNYGFLKIWKKYTKYLG